MSEHSSPAGKGSQGNKRRMRSTDGAAAGWLVLMLAFLWSDAVRAQDGPVCSTFTNKTTANGLGSNDAPSVYSTGSTVYAGTAGGLGISMDGGSTFSNKTTANGLGSNTVRDVYMAGSTLYVATSVGLAISTDGGSTFTNRTNTLNGLATNSIFSVFAEGSLVYAATSGGISISTDGGSTFTSRTTANGLGSNSINDLNVVGGIIYAATNNGLSISTDGGSTFTNRTTANGLGTNFSSGVFVVGSKVYAATIGGLSISTDGGSTFTTKTTANGLGNNAVFKVYAFGNTVYAATQSGLSISTDGGSTFTNLTTTNGLGSNVVKNIFIADNKIYAATGGGLSSCSAPCTAPTSGGSIAAAQTGSGPFDPAAFTSATAASGHSGTLEYKWQSSTTSASAGFSDIVSSNSATYDAGALTQTTWYKRLARASCSSDWTGAVESNVVEVTVNGPVCNSFTSRNIDHGLGGYSGRGVFVVGSTVYAATSWGLSISTDGGLNYVNRTTSEGLGSNVVNKVYAVGSTLYGATEGGLSISTDGGSTFVNRTTANSLGSNNVLDVYAVGSTVYAATSSGFGVSIDGGSNFTNKTTTNGLGSNYVTGVYVVGSTVYAATTGGLSISTDGGASFSNRTTSDGLGDNFVLGVYAAGSKVYAATDFGLSVSTDGGTTFNNFYSGMRSVKTLGVWAAGNTVYVATLDGLSISTNGGTSFISYSSIHGLGNSQVNDVYFADNKIYAATEELGATPGGISFCEGATSWNGSAGTDWSNASNWSPATVPSTSTSIYIPVGLTNYPTVPSTVTLTDLILHEGSFSLGTSEITLTRRLTNNGTISGSGKIKMSSTSAQHITAKGTISNLEISNSNSSGVTILSGSNHGQTLTGVLTMSAGKLVTSSNLTLKSDASGTARVAALGAGATISGNVIAERYIKQNTNISGTGRAWRLVSIPVTGTGTLRNFFMNGRSGQDLTNGSSVAAETVNAGTPIVGHNYATASAATTAGFDWIGIANQVSSLRRYVGNATGGTFLSSDVPVMSTNYTSAEQGYMVFTRGDRKLSFPSSSSSSATTFRSTGALKTGDRSVNIAPAATSKYTLVGNPYMSVLDLSALHADNSAVINPSFWIWDANISGSQRQGGYVKVFYNGTSWVTNTGTYTNPERIESGMAFFAEPVSGLSTTTPIVIKETHKSAATASGVEPFGKEASEGHGMLYARLEIPGTTELREVIDGVLIDFHKDFKMSLGDLSDHEKMRNTISTGGMWLSRDQKLLATEGLPWPGVDKRSIPLYMSAVGSQKLLVRLAPSGLEDRYVKVWLKDNHLNTQSEMDITKGLDYAFSGTGNAASDSTRFEIVYVESGRPTTGQTLDPDGAAREPLVKLSPNPAKSSEVKLTLRSMTPGTYAVQVLDMSGRLLATTSLNHRSVNGTYRILEGRKLSPGTYIIRLSDQDKQPKETLRLIVE